MVYQSSTTPGANWIVFCWRVKDGKPRFMDLQPKFKIMDTSSVTSLLLMHDLKLFLRHIPDDIQTKTFRNILRSLAAAYGKMTRGPKIFVTVTQESVIQGSIFKLGKKKGEKILKDNLEV